MFERVLGRQLRGSKRSVLVLGPRQVGKTTLLASLIFFRKMLMEDERMKVGILVFSAN